MEVSFPIFPTVTPKHESHKMNPTKINIIVSSIPLADTRVINLILLILGATLNLSIILVIVSKPCMRTCFNLYIVSLACSNMLILLEPLEQILQWFFDISMKLNMDYICLINFDVSVITIAILKFVLYINIFQDQLPFGHTLLRRFTTIKGIILVWSASTISLAIGLHIYDFFEGDMADIYVWNTIMFIIMPLVISLALDSLIIYELTILKAIEGSWRTKELKHYLMLIIMAIAFFSIRMPYRLARAINFIEPKAPCCTDKMREVLYFIAKTFPTVFSLIYILLSYDFHEAVQETLKYKYRKSHEKESSTKTDSDTII
ncbi:unnamed protein product [Xylocopa violacea]|uniref:G-protein coupled receptors family 1 profile domain-containing protein n=1 Tax=Xylocopa violacea TaxID=135666 RepID=A0ABP1N0S3_XYLVO